MGKTHTFTLISSSEDCGVIIYDRKTGRELRRQAFAAGERLGRRQRLTMELPEGEYLYQFYEGRQRRADERGRAFLPAKKYGELKTAGDLYTILETPDFDWQGTQNPKIPYEDCLVYCMHVRGFTRHSSSKVTGRGTFWGVTEKIPYLKSIGVTTLEFQPIYEFLERPATAQTAAAAQFSEPAAPPRINYWGYTQGYYYAPKADYAKGEPTTDCRRMIRELHRNGMEAVLQFYFPREFNPMEIPEILRFWVEEYRVDGFHLIGENLPSDQIARLPELAQTKIWYDRFDGEICEKHGPVGQKFPALVRDDYLYDCRRFLKGDENCIPAVMYHMRAIPPHLGQLHYLSSYWGFTLMDMVSYDYKHNEPNGEENHDGADYNCSWNCGEEGFSRKKKIQRLRVQQMKNAYCLLFFSQSTPRIFMGDEFGNSQKGNNNPYCQDNETAWLNWRDLEKNRELTEWFRMLGKLRKSLPVLHPREEAKMMDTISCGYPDLSFHGQTAWRPQMEHSSRQLGVMYCGLYGKDGKKEVEGEFLYLAMNMHQEPHELALPRLGKGMKWQFSFATCEELTGEQPVKNDVVKIPPRTIALYQSKRESAAQEAPGSGKAGNNGNSENSGSSENNGNNANSGNSGNSGNNESNGNNANSGNNENNGNSGNSGNQKTDV